MRTSSLVACGLLALVAAGGSAAAPATPTMSVSWYHSPGAGTRLLAFSGTIPIERAGEDVTILVKECSATAYRAIAAARTDARGRWFKDEVWPVANGVYRVRWRNRLSNTAFLRNVALRLQVEKLGDRRAWRVTATTVAGHDMYRKRVLLQRQSGPGWRTIRTTRLRLGPYPWTYVATFSVASSGLTLRALFPSATNAPCYAAAATAPWRS